MKRTADTDVAPVAKKPRLGDLGARFNQPAFSDIVLRVTSETDPTETTTLHGHRVVLATASPYFEKLFTSGMKETHAQEIEIRADPALFTSLVQWIYGLEETDLSLPDMVRMWHMADRFDVPSIRASLEFYMALPTCMPTCAIVDLVPILVELDGHKQFKNVRANIAHQIAHLMDLSDGLRDGSILDNDIFLGLPLVVVRELLARDDVMVHTEDEILAAVTIWWHKNARDTPSVWQNLVQETIRFPFLTTSTLVALLSVLHVKVFRAKIASALGIKLACAHPDGIRRLKLSPRAYRASDNVLLVDSFSPDSLLSDVAEPVEVYFNGVWFRLCARAFKDGLHELGLHVGVKDNFWSVLLSGAVTVLTSIRLTIEEGDIMDRVHDVFTPMNKFLCFLKFDADPHPTPLKLTIQLGAEETAFFSRAQMHKGTKPRLIWR